MHVTQTPEMRTSEHFTLVPSVHKSRFHCTVLRCVYDVVPSLSLSLSVELHVVAINSYNIVMSLAQYNHQYIDITMGYI